MMPWISITLSIIVVGVIVTALAIYTHEAITHITLQRKR
jgi:hypothetical protein